MFRHSVRQLIKPGEFAAFTDAAKGVNAVIPKVGLPTYNLWVTLFGDANEVWAEAEYESLDKHVELWKMAQANDEVMTAFRAMVAHVVPGSVHDYPLQPLTLD